MISRFSTFWANFIICASPKGPQHSSSSLIHGVSLFTKVSSKTSFGNCGNGATSLSKRFQYSSMVNSYLIAKNIPQIVPSLTDRNLTNNLCFKPAQSLNALRSSCNLYPSNAALSKLITTTISFSESVSLYI